MRFISKSGMNYWFDDKIGISYPVNTLSEIFFVEHKLHSEKKPGDTGKKDNSYQEKFLEKIEKIRVKTPIEPQKQFDDSTIRKLFFRHGLLQMTLGVTEDCNLACKYCVFSTFYQYTRSPTKKKMDFKTAKKALDYYMALLNEGDKFNPTRVTSIGFYGGEPLLNFDLIKKCVNYLHTAYPERTHSYTITTNGTLLNDQIIDFLTENDFSIAVSIDGPQEEHDRNRIYRNGKGTFSDIMKNIKKLVDAKYEKVHSLAVFDVKSDLFRLHEFFSQPDVPQLSNVSMPTPGTGCNYYDQFTDEDIKRFRDTEERAFNYYLDNLKDKPDKISFFDQIFGIYANKVIYSVPSLIDRNNFFVPYTGACIPGRKLFVDASGNYHLCERINSSFPIGDVDNGLDFSKIRQLLENYVGQLDHCESCNAQRLCGKCYCAFSTIGQFVPSSTVCNDFEQGACKDLSKAFTIGERSSAALALVSDDYYKWLAKISTTMGD